MDELLKLEKEIQGIYEGTVFPLGERFAFDLPKSPREAEGRPSVLFLGNHSSGKSSFINHLLGGVIQKTGLAPMDDGFTIIAFGEKKDQFDGQTVITHPRLAYQSLERFGPEFTSRLRLKTVPRDFLKELTLIDSPGMIDTATSNASRGYDFAKSVRHFAETADLILFFFDPDKPGTTGETVSIFTQTLAGLEHKLLIIMNKVDLFSNTRDFARTYGALCWNLSKAIKSKDIPHIYTTYLPDYATAKANSSINLNDFDEAREEVIEEIKRAPTRRTDNLVSDLYKHGRKLIMLSTVCRQIAFDFHRLRQKMWGFSGLALAATLALCWATRNLESAKIPWTLFGIGCLTSAGLWGWFRYRLAQFTKSCATPEMAESAFLKAYREDLARYDRADLRALWDIVLEQTVTAMKLLGPERISRGFQTRKLIKKLEQILDQDVPRLRRSVAQHYEQREQTQETSE